MGGAASKMADVAEPPTMTQERLLEMAAREFIMIGHGSDSDEQIKVPPGVTINIYEITGNAFTSTSSVPLINWITLQHELKFRNMGLAPAINILIPNPKSIDESNPSPSYDVIDSDRHHLQMPVMGQSIGDYTSSVKTCNVYKEGDNIPNFIYSFKDDNVALGLYSCSRMNEEKNGRELHRVGLEYKLLGHGHTSTAVLDSLHSSVKDNLKYVPFFNPDFADRNNIFLSLTNQSYRLSEILGRTPDIPKGDPPIDIHIISCRSLASLYSNEQNIYNHIMQSAASVEGSVAATATDPQQFKAFIESLSSTIGTQVINTLMSNYQSYLVQSHIREMTRLLPTINVFDLFPYPRIFYPYIINNVGGNWYYDHPTTGQYYGPWPFSTIVQSMGGLVPDNFKIYKLTLIDGGNSGGVHVLPTKHSETSLLEQQHKILALPHLSSVSELTDEKRQFDEYIMDLVKKERDALSPQSGVPSHIALSPYNIIGCNMSDPNITNDLGAVDIDNELVKKIIQHIDTTSKIPTKRTKEDTVCIITDEESRGCINLRKIQSKAIHTRETISQKKKLELIRGAYINIGVALNPSWEHDDIIAKYDEEMNFPTLFRSLDRSLVRSP